MVLAAQIANTVFDALESFGVDPSAIARDVPLSELGVDSLDLAELAQVLDDRHGVSFADADLRRIETVGDVLAFAQSQAEAAA